MSEFWLGVFAGLTVWQVSNAVLSVKLQGKTFRYNHETVAEHVTLAIICGTIAWWFATFGGA